MKKGYRLQGYVFGIWTHLGTFDTYMAADINGMLSGAVAYRILQ